MSETCLNEKCGYFTSGEVCTKCGKSQSYLRLESENAALRERNDTATSLLASKAIEIDELRSEVAHTAEEVDSMRIDRDEWKHKAERYRGLLQKGLERMELINGPDRNCVIGDPTHSCANHVWIHAVKSALEEPK